MADDLSRRFGEAAVFMDVDTIRPGRDFRKAIDESIRSCNVLLALVGPDWTGAADAAGHLRLFDDSDYVRLEIASALKRDIAVIPVMVRGAHMPTAELLPDDLSDFAYRNGVELTHARWRSDVQVLMGALGLLLEGGNDPGATAATPTVAPSAVNPGPASVASGSAEIDPDILQAVITELARYIGPIAQVLVKRAARQFKTMAEIVTATAKEIEAPRERAAFVAFCDKWTRTASAR